MFGALPTGFTGTLLHLLIKSDINNQFGDFVVGPGGVLENESLERSAIGLLISIGCVIGIYYTKIKKLSLIVN
jgi:hypothetical protein